MLGKVSEFLKGKKEALTNSKKGFTLIELVIVILIIAILAVVLIPQLSAMTNKAKTTGVQQVFREYEIAAQAVAHEQSGFKELVTGTGATADLTKLVEAMNANLDTANKLTSKTGEPATTTRMDPWKQAYTINYDADAITVTSTGADKTDKTADDLSVTVAYKAGSVETTTKGFSLNAEENKPVV